ncbi:uncharacterized protein MONBRDRAFT_23153 [Monosiga brevicollis MX1]|uniref:Trichoplein keratin filament-binding protein n=1 Tax=Monosiga brevicollis TaxID=81824 RepID=A9URC2_MONBE|nr:uncharacterized protein MONBRDRAFT_23153 [Monosiga brevicollis MX1]EDQ92217.1 predicted protein [Monosiga brevicollis MX1]|eukprot:XP_001743503.1 hypothetical protein [Monosiga brevicollis MX1]
MALPTFRSAFATRKFDAEAAIAARRQSEQAHRQNWQQTANYFQRENVRADKVAEWNSLQSFQRSMRSAQNSIRDEIKPERLAQRRDRLSRLLQMEKCAAQNLRPYLPLPPSPLPPLLSTMVPDDYPCSVAYEQELRDIGPPREDYQSMRTRLADLKLQREQERRLEAESRLHQAWADNDPDMRQLRSNRMRAYYETQREQQASDRRADIEEEQRAAAAERRRLELEAERAREADLERQRRLRDKELQHQEDLDRQVQLLREREAEAERLRREHDQLLLEQARLYEEEERRKQRAAQEQQAHYGRTLRSQHKAAMMRRSRQLQEELETDLRMLEALAEAEAQDKDLKLQRRQRAQEDVEWMKAETRRQLLRERQRELEFEDLYRDEAARVWAKQEAVWEKEQLARERLMQQVLAERQEQIEHKLAKVRSAQQDLITDRETLLRAIDTARQLAGFAFLTRTETTRIQQEAKAEEQEAAARRDMKLAWQDQLAAKMARERAQEREAAEIEALRLQEEATRRARVQSETARITNTSFEPPRFGRRRIPWN